ncbi:biotin/lipoyl-binding protein, partial [bacterium]|nr:biotin/lipoyl-binding protein [candidate division CSSED10-310 bacterium]
MMRHNKQRWFLASWVICAILAGWYYFGWHTGKNCVGIVEAVTHEVGAREAGLIRDLLVTIEDEVQAGQILAVLDTSDIDARLMLLHHELDETKALEEAGRSRYTLELQRLRLQLDNESADLTDRVALLESRQTELTGLNNEIARLQEAETAGL